MRSLQITSEPRDAHHKYDRWRITQPWRNRRDFHWLKKLPESHRIGPTAFVVPQTDAVVDALRHRVHDIHWIDAEAKVQFDYKLLQLFADEENAKLIASFKVNGELPKHNLTLHDERPLAKYQEAALICADRTSGFCLFMEQGTGKTPIVITRVCNDAVKTPDRAHRTLIVCPNNVRQNWANEFERFSTCEIKTQVLRGGLVKRTDLFLTALTSANGAEGVVVICSYGSLVNTPVLLGIDWDLAVLDESHFIKNPRTKRFRDGAVKLRDKSEKRMVLTGTAVNNGPFDLWAQLEFLGEGESGFTSYEAFRNFYGVFDNRSKRDDFEQRLVGLQNLPFLKEKLAQKSFIISKREALPDLPDKVHDTFEVEMTKEQREAYNNLAAHLALEIEAELETSENKQLTVNNILTKLLRLAQITSGFIAWDPVVDVETGDVLRERIVEPILPNPKIEGLLELIQDKPKSSKTIIWACFKEDVRAIRTALQDAGHGVVEFTGSTSDKDRLEAERAFNWDADTRFLVGNPAAGGVGLNLLGYPPGHENVETNCDHVIYYSQNWSATARSQSEDRAHRRGTRQNVRYTDLCIPETIDEEIRTRVLNKIANAMEIQDLREILKKLVVSV